MPQTVFPLTDRADIENNLSKIDILVEENSPKVIAEARANDVKRALAEFARKNGITLINLMAEEEEVLRRIVSKALREEEQKLELFEQELSIWMKKLKHAVAGQGEHVVMHAARSSGMAADLIHTGGVPAGKWGTDLDAKQCLGKEITHPNKISKASAYILPSVSLTERVGYEVSMMTNDRNPYPGEVLVKGEADGLKYKVSGDVKEKTIAWDLLPKMMKHDFKNTEEIKKFIPDILLCTADRGDTSIVPFQEMLNEVSETVADKNINGDISIRIPVNCGNQHWRLAKIDFKNQRMISAVLWDSLQPGQEAEVKQTPAFQNFTKIVQAYGVNPELKLAGIQNNAYSCLDYSLQEAYKDAGIENEISRAKNASDLRLAVVKQIATNHENIHDEVIGQLVMQKSGVIDFGGEVAQNEIATLSPSTERNVETFLEKFVDETQAKTLTQEDKDWQITFDAVFSEHLQDLYHKNPDHRVEEEDALVREARRRAMLELGFFPSAERNNKHVHKPEATNTNSFTKK